MVACGTGLCHDFKALQFLETPEIHMESTDATSVAKFVFVSANNRLGEK